MNRITSHFTYATESPEQNGWIFCDGRWYHPTHPLTVTPVPADDDVLAEFHDAILRSDSLTPVGFDCPEPEGREAEKWRNTAGDYATSQFEFLLIFAAGLILGWFLKGL